MNFDSINVEETIKEFKDKYLGSDFKFREGQIETITQIIESYKNGKKYVILSAPTGSGKSIIAMIVSYIFNKIKKQSYILTSELTLQRQYDYDITKYKLPYVSLEGRDNYICTENYEKVTQGYCYIYRLNRNELPCKHTCPYFSVKQKALLADTSILNYSYWLTQTDQFKMDYDPKAGFVERDLVICDEAHVVMDVLRNRYSLSLNETFLKNVDFVRAFVFDYNLGNLTNTQKLINAFYYAILNCSDKMSLWNLLILIRDQIVEIKKYVDMVDGKLLDKYKDSEKEMPPQFKKIIKLKSYFENLVISLVDIIEICGTNKNIHTLIKSQQDLSITFNTLDDNYISKKYFLPMGKYFLFMSASIVDGKFFMKTLGINDAVFIKMKNPFTYEKSPIIYDNALKMNYQNTNTNLPLLCSKIEKILDNHQNQRGVIHTGSYNLSIMIYHKLKPQYKKRILLYEGTQEKRNALSTLKDNKRKDLFIMGPSLTTGVDLPGEYCKVIIVAKMPYMSLANQFNVEKSKLDLQWYPNKCIEELLQSLGRGIRYPADPERNIEEDHCMTYILDGSLDNLIRFNSFSFPQEFFKRLRKEVVG